MGTAYESSKQLLDVLAELARQMFAQEGLREQFVALGVTVKFSITDPDCVVYLDPQDAAVVRPGDDSAADLTLAMTADHMHDFWMGKTNIIESLGNGALIVTAAAHVPAVKSVDLLPLLLPGLDLYPGLRERG